MVGIVDYAAYIPSYRLQRDFIAEQWRTRSLGGTKAVANFNQDALTLGYEAAWSLIEQRGPADALYFASTSSPYWQRAASSLIAAACDLPDEAETIDFAATTRAGTSALRAALNAVLSGANRRVIVTAADVRDALPGSAEEQLFGDAAAAVMIGREKIVAELVAQTSKSDVFLDEWRRDCDRYIRSLRSRYSLERGYEANVVAIGQRVLEIAGIKASDIARAALASPDERAHLGAAKKLGLAPEQLVDIPVKSIGITGTAMPLLLLCTALDEAAPGDLVLAVGYGDGADAVLFRITDEPRGLAREISNSAPIEIPSYTIYCKLRNFTRLEGEERTDVTNVMLEKEERQNLRLHATRCQKCGTVQLPLTAVCVKCRSREHLQEVPMSRRGTIFTFTKDYLYPAPNPPTAMAVIELEDGARFYCQVTDIGVDEVKIGRRVKLTLRRLRESGGMHHYYWNCRPI